MKYLLLALAVTVPADAATLRPFANLTGPSVNLSDLFEDVAVDHTLGPAPAPGGRIVVEAGQLAAIARQFKVDWQPASSADRAVLDRPGRALGRDDFFDDLKRGLVLAGAPNDVEVDLAPISAPLVPDHVPIQVNAGPVEFEPITGRFTALATVSAAGMAPIQVRLAGKMAEMLEVVVPRRRIAPGERLLARDVVLARLHAGQARGEVVKNPAQAVGLEARRTLQPGQAIQSADIGRPTLVSKGGRVSMSLAGPGIDLSAQGVALEAAGLNEMVAIINPASKVVVHAIVTGMGQARVIPDEASSTASNRQVAAQ